MGQTPSLSVTEFPSYFVRVRLSIFVPIDNVIGGLIAEDFHLTALATRAKCKVFLQNVPDADCLWVPVVIEGQAMHAYDACRLVIARVEEVDAVVLEFRLAKPRHTWLAERVAEIGVETEARIAIPNAYDDDDYVTIEGSFDTVAYAFEKLYDIVKVKGKEKTFRHAMIPTEKVPGIIGSKGNTIRMLQEVSQAAVAAPPSRGTTAAEVPFTVSGSENAVAFASAIMALMCKNMGFREAVSLAEKELMDVSIFPEVGTVTTEHHPPASEGHAGARFVQRSGPGTETEDALVASMTGASVSGPPRIKSRQSKSWQARDAAEPFDGDVPRDDKHDRPLFVPPKGTQRGGRVTQPHSRGRGSARDDHE